MKKLMLALTTAALIAAPSMAGKIACRNAKGQAAKCPPAAVMPTGDTYKDKTGKCHWTAGPKKGKFAPCPK